MTDATADITKYPQGSTENLAAIEDYIQRHNASAAARAAAAPQHVDVGGVRIARPAPTVETPAPPAEPVVELGPEWAPFADDIAHASQAAERSGFASFYGALAMLKGLDVHERTPATASPEERLTRADAAADRLVQMHGEERTDELIGAWRAAVIALGIGDLMHRHGADTNAEFIDFVARRWLEETKR